MWLGEIYWNPARPPIEAVSMEILEIIKIKLFSIALSLSLFLPLQSLIKFPNQS